ncbi:MAG: dephospho-CoA kinase [Clostridiales bacterium]|nr:dephospho-CoA kinase [Clostridiales bacterium]
MGVIGLTGTIGSGKSTVSGYLRSLGAVIVDADEISRSLTAPGGRALIKIRESFGDKVFSGDALDRKALAGEVFSDKEKLQKLNSILHPLIFEQMFLEINEAVNGGAKHVIADVPLLFETGFEKHCDEIWLVYTDEKTQLERIVKRDNCTEEAAKARIANQMPVSEKMKKSDRLIDNSGDLDSLFKQVENLWQSINEKM